VGKSEVSVVVITAFCHINKDQFHSQEECNITEVNRQTTYCTNYITAKTTLMQKQHDVVISTGNEYKLLTDA